ncbi:hypothetical protein L6452_33928 [Arctium lappa]|uniref:Uncharacterized protein n=1 Tax=Arctium lappa TaxID=4217 RepID=A0ACB8YGY6_ARCLA|nr:hypothetical protein L6452_33928 [Arctium lappa]
MNQSKRKGKAQLPFIYRQQIQSFVVGLLLYHIIDFWDFGPSISFTYKDEEDDQRIGGMMEKLVGKMENLIEDGEKVNLCPQLDGNGKVFSWSSIIKDERKNTRHFLIE